MDPDGATIDHIVPLSLGGSDEPANVATAHRRCNIRKGDQRVPHSETVMAEVELPRGPVQMSIFDGIPA